MTIIEMIESNIEELRTKFNERVELVGVQSAADKIGVDKSYVSRIYNGRQKVQIEKLIELYKKL